MMLACRRDSPDLSLPSSAVQASLALVPVPQGERSHALRTENKVTAVRVIILRKQFDMIDNALMFATDACTI